MKGCSQVAFSVEALCSSPACWFQALKHRSEPDITVFKGYRPFPEGYETAGVLSMSCVIPGVLAHIGRQLHSLKVRPQKRWFPTRSTNDVCNGPTAYHGRNLTELVPLIWFGTPLLDPFSPQDCGQCLRASDDVAV